MLATIWLILVPAVLSAQEGGQVSMKIDVVAWGDSIGGLSFKSGKREGKITAHAFTYSEPINYRGPRVMEVHQSGNTGGQDTGPVSPEDQEHESKPLIDENPKRDEPTPKTPLGKELAKRREEDPTLVSLVPLPTNARRVTVLLTPAAEGTYKGYVINDDPSKLPPGKLRVHNLSPHPIRMVFGDKQATELQPRKTFLANAPKGHAAYKLAYKEGNKWKIQENNIIPVRPTEQTQFIVLKSTNQFFLSADGASGGYLQTVVLRRPAKTPATP